MAEDGPRLDFSDDYNLGFAWLFRTVERHLPTWHQESFIYQNGDIQVNFYSPSQDEHFEFRYYHDTRRLMKGKLVPKGTEEAL